MQFGTLVCTDRRGKGRVVIEDRARNPVEEGEGNDMSFQEAHRRLSEMGLCCSASVLDPYDFNRIKVLACVPAWYQSDEEHLDLIRHSNWRERWDRSLESWNQADRGKA